MIIRRLWCWSLLLLLFTCCTQQSTSFQQNNNNNNKDLSDFIVKQQYHEFRSMISDVDVKERYIQAVYFPSSPTFTVSQEEQFDASTGCGQLGGTALLLCDTKQSFGFAVTRSSSSSGATLVAVFPSPNSSTSSDSEGITLEVFQLPPRTEIVNLACDSSTCSKLFLQFSTSLQQHGQDSEEEVWWSVDYGQHWQQHLPQHSQQQTKPLLPSLSSLSSLRESETSGGVETPNRLLVTNTEHEALQCGEGHIPYLLLLASEESREDSLLLTCKSCADPGILNNAYSSALCRHLATAPPSTESYSDAEVISQTVMSLFALLWMMVFAIIYIFQGRFVQVTDARRQYVLQPLLICMESITNVLRSKVDAEEDLTELIASPTRKATVSCWKLLTVLCLMAALPILVFVLVVCIYATYSFFSLALVYQNYSKTSSNHSVQYISKLMLKTMLPLPDLFRPLLSPAMHAMNSLADASLTFTTSSGMMNCVGVQYSLLLLIRLVILLNLVIFLCSRYPSLLGTAFVKFLKYFERWKLSSRQGYESYIIATSVYWCIGCVLMYSNIFHLLLQYGMSMIAFFKHHGETMYSASECASLTSPPLHSLIEGMEQVPILIGFIFIQPMIYSASIILVPKLPTWMRIDAKHLRDMIFIAHHNQPEDTTNRSPNYVLVFVAKMYYRLQHNRFFRGFIYRAKVIATYASIDLILMEFFIRACRLISNWMRLSKTFSRARATNLSQMSPTIPSLAMATTSSSATVTSTSSIKRESMMAVMMKMTASLDEETNSVFEADEENHLKAPTDAKDSIREEVHHLSGTTWQNVINSFPTTADTTTVQDESILEESPELIFMATSETVAATRDDILPSYLELSQIVYQHFLLPPSAALSDNEQGFTVKSTVQHLFGIVFSTLTLPIVVVMALMYAMISYFCCSKSMNAFRELEDNEEVEVKPGFCRTMMQKASMSFFALFSRFMRILCFFLSYTIAGHLMTDFGRQCWTMVLWNYYIFCLTAMGVWTEDAMVAFAIKEDDIILDKASQCKLGLTIASVDQFENWGKTRRKYDMHRLWFAIASRALFFQLHATLTILSIYVTNTAMIPLAVYTKEIDQHPWFAVGAYSQAVEREVESNYRWTAPFQAVHDFLHQSRTIQYLVHLLLTMIPVLYVFRGNEDSDAKLHIALGYLFLFICLVWTVQYSANCLHYLGKYLHITDADLGLAMCWKQLELNKIKPVKNDATSQSVPSAATGGLGVTISSKKKRNSIPTLPEIVESFQNEDNDSSSDSESSSSAKSTPRKEDDVRRASNTTSPVTHISREGSSRNNRNRKSQISMMSIDEKVEDIEDLEQASF